MPNWTKHPILPIPTRKQLEALLEKEGAKAVYDVWAKREEAIKLSNEDPLNYGFELESWANARESLDVVDSLIISGGNRCLTADTKVFDPVENAHISIGDIKKPFHVLSEHNGRAVVCEASVPFVKGKEEVYKVTLSNGASFRCSHNHLILSAQIHGGSYQPLSLLRTGCEVYLPPSSLGIDPLVSQPNEQHCYQRVEDFLSDCRPSFRLCDELLHEALESVQDAFPLLGDVEERTLSFGTICHLLSPHVFYSQLSKLGDLAYSPSGSLFEAESLLANWYDRLQTLAQSAGIESCVFYKLYKSALRLLLDQELLLEYLLPTAEFSPRFQSSCESGQQGNQFHLFDLSSDKNKECNSKVSISITSIVEDGYEEVYDIEVPIAHNYYAGGCYHHNSSKTEWSAKMVVEAAINNPRAEIVCFAQDATASVRTQQRSIYRYLPPELKQKTKSSVAYLNYSQQNGFTGDQFILPNGSAIYFHMYSQFQANRGKFEGLELGSQSPTVANIGLWLDEYLEDGDLVKTMVFRLVTRDAKMIISATPVKGYTPFIGSYLKNAQTIKTRPAALLNNEEVPVVQRNHAQNLDIVYFHSDQNPFGGYDRIARELRDKPRDFILTRAYGIPVKSMTTLFPLFNTAVHVTKERINVSNKKQWTCYQVVDPAGARNYVAIWAAVNEKGYVHIFREWPDLPTYGPWAEFGDPKWKHGPASDKIGYTVQGYVDLFKEIEDEHKVEPYERIGDSRYFARENADNSDLFEEFSEKGMYFVPSDGREIDIGINALDEWFWYNANEPVDSSNRPLLTIDESCGNLIHALINWGHGGKKDEALKDFVDALRYLRLHNGGDGPDHVATRSMETTRTTKGGY